jgi:hypothetical protein
MGVELLLSAVTTMGFGVIALFEYFAQTRPGKSAPTSDRSNRPVRILLGLCVVIGNLIIWTPAMFGW